jgi:hypothetical protein
MIDSYSVYLPRPQEDLRAWLQSRWDRINDATFFIVHAPGPQDVAGEYQVLMCIHHAGPDPRPGSQRADEFLRQVIERQRASLSQLEEPLDGADLYEAHTSIPESWLEAVYNAITLKVTAFHGGIDEIFITVGDPRAADRCQVFVQQLMEIPGAKLASVEPAKRDGDAPKPWEIIPDVGWNRKAVELWHAGYKAGEIAAKIGNLTAKTVYNRLSDLRRIYGTDVVPERRAKSRPGRKLG